jgi:hypothetical protein
MHSGFGVLYFLCDFVVLSGCVGGGGIWSRVSGQLVFSKLFSGCKDLQLHHKEEEWVGVSFLFGFGSVRCFRLQGKCFFV